MLEINDIAPNFTFLDEQGQEQELSSLQGKKVVLYFYPKDDTPGCTIEAQDFASLHSKFEAANIVIIGISRDNMSSHKKFKEKYCLPFLLVSDSEKIICEQYGVLKEKSMFGKKYFGIDRSSFLIDAEGKIAKIWRNVTVRDHAKLVLEAANNLA